MESVDIVQNVSMIMDPQFLPTEIAPSIEESDCKNLPADSPPINTYELPSDLPPIDTVVSNFAHCNRKVIYAKHNCKV